MKSSQCTSRSGKAKNYSKLLATFFSTLFAGTVLLGVIAAFAGTDTSVYIYIIPATGTVAATSASFYYTKAKAENLSKQRIRYVLMKLLLREKIDGETYTEICNEIDNIDMAIESKIGRMTQEAIDENTNNIF